ncbi:hypothetical protein HAX54_004890 [Datura stramonium]|uniref:Uncharacterized protein n=1 Tax=Datura stramonium TaxID=4076 RepID=A0ABS8T964_DATST|nr:hypothetical protein [Datura stramonium]
MNHTELANDQSDDSNRDSLHDYGEEDDQLFDEAGDLNEDYTPISPRDDSVSYHFNFIPYLDHIEEGPNDFAHFRDNDVVRTALWNPKNPKYLKSGMNPSTNVHPGPRVYDVLPLQEVHRSQGATLTKNQWLQLLYNFTGWACPEDVVEACRISLDYLLDMGDFFAMSQQAWGAATFAFLYNCLCRASMTVARDVCGFVPLLQWRHRGNRDSEARNVLIICRDVLDCLSDDQCQNDVGNVPQEPELEHAGVVVTDMVEEKQVTT